MIAWWNGLQSRERWLVGSGGVLAPLLLLYLLAWEPMVAESRRLAERLAEQQALEQWMVAAVAEVGRLRAAGERSVADDGRSLLTQVDQGVKQAGLAAALKRVKPEGEGRVSLWFEGVGFDPLLGWLATLTEGAGVTTESLLVTRTATAGRVDARLVVERPLP